jgi:hypothetical protein
MPRTFKALRELILFPKSDESTSPEMYTRMHNRHNRSWREVLGSHSRNRDRSRYSRTTEGRKESDESIIPEMYSRAHNRSRRPEPTWPKK